MTIEGSWNIVMSTPMGDREGTASFKADGDVLTGIMTNEFGDTEVEDGEIDGDHLFWRTRLTQPMAMTLEFEVDIDGDTLSGSAKLGAMGEAPMRGTRLS